MAKNKITAKVAETKKAPVMVYLLLAYDEGAAKGFAFTRVFSTLEEAKSIAESNAKARGVKQALEWFGTNTTIYADCNTCSYTIRTEKLK